MAKKKFIIIQPGTNVFPENGKKRVRVFQDDSEDTKKRAEATKEETEALKENTDAQKENTDARNENTEAVEGETKAVKELNVQTSINQNRAEELISTLKGQFDQYVNLEGATGKYAAAQSEVLTLQKELAQAEVEGNDVKIQIVKSLLDQAVASRDLAEAADGVNKDSVKLGETLEKLQEDFLASQTNVLKYEEVLRKLGDTTTLQGASLAAFSSTLSTVGLSSLDVTAGFSSVLGMVGEMTSKIDKSNIALQQQTGFGKEAITVSNQLVRENTELGISNDDAVKAFTSLNKTVSSFSALSADAQKQMAKTVVEMERLGVSGEASAKAIDLLDRSMGMTTEEAGEALETFDDLAKKLALPTGQVVEDFGKIGPKLARFGKNGKDQFDLLAKKARELGVGVSEAFDIAEKFDTFEGAADLAGKLNAQLGMQLNSVAMMGASSHAERLNMLKKEFDNTGKSFDKLHRREKQALAEMMGMEVDMAAKFFGNPAEYAQARDDQEKAEERAKRLTAFADKMATIGDRLATFFTPVVGIFSAIANILANPAIGATVLILTSTIGLFKSAVFLLSSFNKMKAVAISLQKIGIGQTLAEAAATGTKAGAEAAEAAATSAGAAADTAAAGANAARTASEAALTGATLAGLQADLSAHITNLQRAASELTLAKAQGVNAAATASAASVAFAAAIPMLALAAAIFLIGAGIGIAAYGMAAFVGAFAELNIEQMFGAGIGAVALGAGLFFLTKALLGLAPTMAITYPVLLLFASAIGAIGVGLGLVAYGMSMFSKSFAELGGNVSVAAEGFEKITRVVEVVTGVDDSGMEKMDNVFNKITKVMVESNNANVPALTAIADAVAPAAGGGNGAGEKRIELKVNERILGDVVVSIMEDRYDLTPR